MSGLRNKTIQRVLIGLITVIIAVIIVENGAAPKKYRLESGESSKYDITAPRDIVNVMLTEKMAMEAAEKIPPVMQRLDDVPIDIINGVNEFTDHIEKARQNIITLYGQHDNTSWAEPVQLTEQQIATAAEPLIRKTDELGISFSEEQISFLIVSATDEEVSKFETMLISTISEVMKTEVNIDNLSAMKEYIGNVFQISDLPQELKDMGGITANALLKPNSVVDEDATKMARAEAYEAALENKQIIPEGTRIISYGDIVTEDKLAVLRELNLLETEGFDYGFALGIMAVVLMLSFLLILYIRNFCSRILQGTKEIILLCHHTPHTGGGMAAGALQSIADTRFHSTYADNHPARYQARHNRQHTAFLHYIFHNKWRSAIFICSNHRRYCLSFYCDRCKSEEQAFRLRPRDSGDKCTGGCLYRADE